MIHLSDSDLPTQKLLFLPSYLCEDENMHYILPHSCHSLLGREIDAVIAHIAYYAKAENKHLTRYMSYTILKYSLITNERHNNRS